MFHVERACRGRHPPHPVRRWGTHEDIPAPSARGSMRNTRLSMNLADAPRAGTLDVDGAFRPGMFHVERAGQRTLLGAGSTVWFWPGRDQVRPFWPEDVPRETCCPGAGMGSTRFGLIGGWSAFTRTFHVEQRTHARRVGAGCSGWVPGCGREASGRGCSTWNMRVRGLSWAPGPRPGTGPGWTRERLSGRGVFHVERAGVEGFSRIQPGVLDTLTPGGLPPL
jgi:hypothetical protein